MPMFFAATKKLRKLVSKKKNRFTEDGYDLDLTYISDRVIAMGFPSTGKEKYYRNDRDSVKQFMEQYHKDKYSIYNLCTERGYEESFFDQRVERFPFEDHNPPPFAVMLPACRSMDTFLSEDPKNIIAIHCKAGKGRTGVIICTYMVYCQLYNSADDALKVYGLIRTKDGKGVTINSQKRYVDYFCRCVADNYTFPIVDATVKLKSLILHTIPHCSKDGGSAPYFMIDSFKATHQMGSKNPTTLTTNIYDSKKFYKPKAYKTTDKYVIEDIDLELSGDVKFRFYHAKKTGSDEKLFHLHFNTNFMHVHVYGQSDGKTMHIFFPKSELDGKTRKDMKKHKLFDSDFAVEFVVELISPGKTQQARVPEETKPQNFGNIRHASVMHNVQTSQGSESPEDPDDTDSDYGDADEA